MISKHLQVTNNAKTAMANAIRKTTKTTGAKGKAAVANTWKSAYFRTSTQLASSTPFVTEKNITYVYFFNFTQMREREKSEKDNMSLPWTTFEKTKRFYLWHDETFPQGLSIRKLQGFYPFCHGHETD